MGIRTSSVWVGRAWLGRMDGGYRMGAPSAVSRSRTRGWRTATGPMPVMISRSERWPWRTTRCWRVSVLRSLCFARNSATSASTAWVSRARAPLRRISVRESVKAPGWASLMTLLSDTAYHSFIGEVEALNTTTIRRLTRSRRHQLLVIAPAGQARTGAGTVTSQMPRGVHIIMAADRITIVRSGDGPEEIIHRFEAEARLGSLPSHLMRVLLKCELSVRFLTNRPVTPIWQ